MLLKKAQSLIYQNSIKILACDVSYKSTGYCLLRKYDNRSIIEKSGVLECESMGKGFDGYHKGSRLFQKTVSGIRKIEDRVDIIIFEMPWFSPKFGSSAISAASIGIVWGALAEIPDVYPIKAGLVKGWSQSKKGDGKDKVLEMVQLRTGTEKFATTDEVDAIATALMFSDLISILKNKNKT